MKPRHYMFNCLLAGAISTSLFLSPTVPEAKAKGAIAEPTELSEYLAWATPGAWVDGDTLLFADLTKGLASISRDGRVDWIKSPMRVPGQEVSGHTDVRFQPGLIRSGRDGQLLIDDEGPDWLRIVSVDYAQMVQEEHWAPKPEDEYWSASKTLEPSASLFITALYDWQPLNGGIIGYGDFQKASGEEFSSFFFSGKNGSYQFLGNRLSPPEWYDGVRDFYVRHTGVVAVQGDRGYILKLELDEQENSILTSILEVYGPGYKTHEYLLALPDFAKTPRLMSAGSASQRASARGIELYRQVEASQLTYGLYATEAGLFVLSKEPRGQRGTRWQFSQLELDEKVARPFATSKFQTTAASLLVVPPSDEGEGAWAFLELSRVEALGSARKVAFRPAHTIRFVESVP